MTDYRKAELFDSAMGWVCSHTTNIGDEEYAMALKEIGYTAEECMEELTTEYIAENPITSIWNVYYPTIEVDYGIFANLLWFYNRKMDVNYEWTEEDEKNYVFSLDYSKEMLLIADNWSDADVVYAIDKEMKAFDK